MTQKQKNSKKLGFQFEDEDEEEFTFEQKPLKVWLYDDSVTSQTAILLGLLTLWDICSASEAEEAETALRNGEGTHLLDVFDENPLMTTLAVAVMHDAEQNGVTALRFLKGEEILETVASIDEGNYYIRKFKDGNKWLKTARLTVGEKPNK
jgi:hypothetical protein